MEEFDDVWVTMQVCNPTGADCGDNGVRSVLRVVMRPWSVLLVIVLLSAI